MQKVRKAVFPVAGLGTRFLPATKAIPKEMLTIVDKPLIQYAVEEALEAGIEDIIFVTCRGKSVLEDHFDSSPELERALIAKGRNDLLEKIKINYHVACTRQSEPKGLGHAVWCAKNLVGDEPFAVILADDLMLSNPPCLREMVKLYNELGGNVVAVEDVPREQTYKYGILDVESDNGMVVKAKGLVEKPTPEEAPSTVSIIGRYILSPKVFEYLDKQERGAGGEIQLTDAIAKTMGSVPSYGYRFKGQRYDCGSRKGFVLANAACAIERDDVNEDILGALKDLLKQYEK